MTGSSICKEDVRLGLCVCALLRLHQPPADRTKAAMPFVLSVSFFLLLAHTVPSLWWVHSEASACLSHTYIYTFGMPGSQSWDKVYSCFGPERRVFWVLLHYFWFVLSYKCLFCQEPYFSTDKWHIVSGAFGQTQRAGSPQWANLRKFI